MENNEILESIKAGGAKMRPRWHFILQTTLTMVGFVIALFMVVYLISFIIFVERQTGAGFIPAFGLRGWARFLISLPWFLILFSLLFMGILELLVRRYSFAYRRPLMFSALGIIVIVGLSSFVVTSVRFHERFEGYAERTSFPLAPRIYRSYMVHKLPDINSGRVVELREGGFLLNRRGGESVRVMVTPQTNLPLQRPFQPGDTVVVFGDREGTSSVRALGIRLIAD